MEADRYSWGRFFEYTVVSVNLGRGENRESGLKYLLSPITDERYQDIKGRPWQDVAKDNPDLEWGELQPGQILVYKGGKPENMPLLVKAGPVVEGAQSYARFELSDALIPLPPVH
ncbi:MAG: hypothetical protein LRY76_09465 [Alphaproteobacteria bacterium]|nr:hypothetical protein [Alphaproteobacteria bacterium]